MDPHPDILGYPLDIALARWKRGSQADPRIRLTVPWGSGRRGDSARGGGAGQGIARVVRVRRGEDGRPEWVVAHER